jgi:hypothetical protein
MDPIVRIRAAALAVLVTFSCGPGAEGPDSQRTPPSPDSIASGLRPAIQTEGQPPNRFTIEERLAHHQSRVPGTPTLPSFRRSTPARPATRPGRS